MARKSNAKDRKENCVGNDNVNGTRCRPRLLRLCLFHLLRLLPRRLKCQQPVRQRGTAVVARGECGDAKRQNCGVLPKNHIFGKVNFLIRLLSKRRPPIYCLLIFANVLFHFLFLSLVISCDNKFGFNWKFLRCKP